MEQELSNPLNYFEIKKLLEDKIQYTNQHIRPILEQDVKYKRCGHHIVALHIPHYIDTNEERDDVCDKRFAKFRAEKAWCIGILNIKSRQFSGGIEHIWESRWLPSVFCRYREHEWVVPNGFDDCMNNICAQGIHFFQSLLAAYCYNQTAVTLPEKAWMCFDEDGSVYYFEKNMDCAMDSGPHLKSTLESLFGISDLKVQLRY